MGEKYAKIVEQSVALAHALFGYSALLSGGASWLQSAFDALLNAPVAGGSVGRGRAIPIRGGGAAGYN